MSVLSAILALTLLTNAVDTVRQVAAGMPAKGIPFDVTGTVVSVRPFKEAPFIIEDASGSLQIERENTPLTRLKVAPGDRVRVWGAIDTNGIARIGAMGADGRILAHGEPPPERTDATAAQVLDHRVDFRLVRLRGIVQDARVDETDGNYAFLMVQNGGDTVFCVFTDGHPSQEVLTDLIGAEVEVSARVTPYSSEKRPFTTHELYLHLDGLTTLRSAEELRAHAPSVATLAGVSPSRFTALGPHAVRGNVLVLFNRDSALVLTETGGLVVLDDILGELPRPGADIEAVGIPRTDLHSVHLFHAKWRPVAGTVPSPSSARDIAAAELPSEQALLDRRGFNLFGTLVRLRATVKALPRADLGERTLLLEADGLIVRADLSSLGGVPTDLKVGATVALTAVCVPFIDTWQPGESYARVRGFALVPRTADDIRILAEPPWWTPLRLLVVIGTLLVALLVILIWNAALRRVAERRGRQLFRAEIANVRSELRVEERTRLAIELHDSLAQDLTGVSMELETVQRSRTGDPQTLFRHVDIAERTLRSCRNELRNTLWDLRNQALEERSVEAAIRQTLLPHVRGVELAVRFNVPRIRLSDSTLHEILCVIRELAVNGIRHGGAKKIAVAGSLETERLLFSVRDDGHGFDPDRAPGVAQGHFGLDGVRKRLRRLGGTLALSSRPGRGTVARATIRPPQVLSKEVSA